MDTCLQIFHERPLRIYNTQCLLVLVKKMRNQLISGNMELLVLDCCVLILFCGFIFPEILLGCSSLFVHFEFWIMIIYCFFSLLSDSFYGAYFNPRSHFSMNCKRRFIFLSVLHFRACNKQYSGIGLNPLHDNCIATLIESISCPPLLYLPKLN